MGNEIVDIVKATPNILGEVYKDLAQPSVRAIGKALGTVFEFSTAILLVTIQRMPMQLLSMLRTEHG